MSIRDTITAYAEKQYPVYRQLALEITVIDIIP